MSYFQVVENPVRTLWSPCDTTSSPVLTEGQLVQQTGDGVGALAVASGAADTSQLQVPWGVITGFNTRYPAIDSTYGVQSVTSSNTSQASQLARDFRLNEGMWAKSDPQLMAKIDVIDANTVLRGRLMNGSTVNTAPTLLTVTTGSTTGLGFTSNATQMTPVADLCTTYCRTGANLGLYRISDDASTTVETNDVAFPYDIAIGDTLIRVPLRPQGLSYVQLNSTSNYVGLWFDVSASPATNYFIINVLELDLKTSGEESVLFSFHPCHFDKVRA